MKRALALICAVVMVMTMCTFYTASVIVSAEDAVTTLAELNAKIAANEDVVLGADIDFQPDYDISYNATTGNIEVTGVGTSIAKSFTIGTGSNGTTRGAVAGTLRADDSAITALPSDFKVWASYGTYTGTLDGAGYTISDIYAVGPIFGTIAKEATVENLNIEAYTYIASIGGGRQGILTPNLYGDLVNVHVYGVMMANVTGNYVKISGVVGGAYSTTQLANYGTVTSATTYDELMALAATNKEIKTPLVDKVTFDGLVSVGRTNDTAANVTIGGIIGQSQGTKVYNCENKGTIDLTTKALTSYGIAGICGLVELSQAQLTYKTNATDETSTKFFCFGPLGVDRTIEFVNCANIGTVEGGNMRNGGLIGFADLLRISTTQKLIFNNLYNGGLVNAYATTGGASTGRGNAIGSIQNSWGTSTFSLTNGDQVQSYTFQAGTKHSTDNVSVVAGSQALNLFAQNGKSGGGWPNASYYHGNTHETRNADDTISAAQNRFGVTSAAACLNMGALGDKRAKVLWVENADGILELDYNSGAGTEEAPFVFTDGTQLLALSGVINGRGGYVGCISDTACRDDLSGGVYVELGSNIEINKNATVTYDDTVSEDYIKVVKGATTYYVGTGKNTALQKGWWYNDPAGDANEYHAVPVGKTPDTSKGEVASTTLVANWAAVPAGINNWYPIDTIVSISGLDDTTKLRTYTSKKVVLDGKGYKVSGILQYNQTAATDAGNSAKHGRTGLFASLSGGSVVKNLTIDDSFFISANNGASAFVGIMWDGATVDNCVNYATVVGGNPGHNTGTGTAYLTANGGIVAAIKNLDGRRYTSYNNNVVTNCKNYGSVLCLNGASGTAIGGIVGIAMQGATIKYNANYGTVKTYSTTKPYGEGGIIGGAELGININNEATGKANKPCAYATQLEVAYNINYGKVLVPNINKADGAHFAGNICGYIDPYWVCSSATEQGYVRLTNNAGLGLVCYKDTASATNGENNLGRVNGCCNNPSAYSDALGACITVAVPNIVNNFPNSVSFLYTDGARYFDFIGTLNKLPSYVAAGTIPEKLFWVDYTYGAEYDTGAATTYADKVILIDNSELQISGTGTAADPYIIRTAAALKFLSESANWLINNIEYEDPSTHAITKGMTNIQNTYGSGTARKAYQDITKRVSGTDSIDYATLEGLCFKLGADITLTDLTVSGTTVSEGTYDYFQPICYGLECTNYTNRNGFTPTIRFKGTFDGDNHTISGIYGVDQIAGGVCTGLFGASSGTIKNVKIANSYFAGTYGVSAVASYCNSTIDNVEVLSSVYVNNLGANQTGAFTCWQQGGNIQNSTNRATVTSGYMAAGFVGTSHGNVKNCTNYGAISSRGDNAAGIVASYIKTGATEVSGCVNYGTISVVANRAAGIVCYSSYAATPNSPFVIKDCTNYGAVSVGTNGTYAGGIMAFNEDYTTISNCTNEGTVTAKYNAGGIIGQMSGKTISGVEKICTITDCVNNGTIVATGANGAGIAGVLYGGNGRVEVAGCTNNADITVTAGQIGGIVAYAEQANYLISECVNNGDITAKNRLGGILGYQSNLKNGTAENRILATIELCTNNGAITGTGANVAGIVGEYSENMLYSDALITKNVNNGAIYSSVEGGGANVAGIVGWVYPQGPEYSIFVSYNINNGSVNAPNATTANIGGIVATANGEQASFMDGETEKKSTDVKTTYIYGNLNTSTEISNKNGKAHSMIGWGSGILNKNFGVSTGAAGEYGTVLTATQIKNGYAAYLINNLAIEDTTAIAWRKGTYRLPVGYTEGATVMYQNLGEDATPVFDNTHDVPTAVTEVPALDGDVIAYVDMAGNYYKGGEEFANATYVVPVEVSAFYTLDGASIRTAAPYGIRFETQVEGNLDIIDGGDELFGTIIVPTAYITGATTKYGAADAQTLVDNDVTRLEIDNSGWFTNNDGVKTYCGSVVNVLEKNLTKDFSAVSYIKITYVGDTEATYITAGYGANDGAFAEADFARNITEVAVSAKADQTYFDGLAVEAQDFINGIIGD